MPKLTLLLTFAFTTIACKCAHGQIKRSSPQKEDTLINKSLLIGKWRSENDSRYIVSFDKRKFTAAYGKGKADTLDCVLSGSCLLKDSTQALTKKKAFLLFYSEGKVQQCNEILNLEKKLLSWMNLDNGHIFIFLKKR